MDIAIMCQREISIYVRLSKADCRGSESESIQNQKQLLLRYCRQQKEFANLPIKIYEDDGYSGLQENRPAWQKLLAQIRQKQTAVVLVKDLSRISRDQFYLANICDKIFPEYKVRLISIGDSYDSSEDFQNLLALRFKNLFYAYYSKDLSRKVKTALEVKKQQGEYAVARVPFGYRKIGEKWVIHKSEAALVREMFVLARLGENLTTIARKLQGKARREVQECQIYPVKVGRILQNPVYCGIHVWHKYENDIVQKQKGKLLVVKEWQMAPGKHPVIIPKNLFVEVNAKRNSRIEDIKKMF